MSKLVNCGLATLPSGTGGVAIDCGFAPKAVLLFFASVRSGGSRGLNYACGVVTASGQAHRATHGLATNTGTNARLRIGTDACGWLNDGITVSRSISTNTLTLTPSGSLPETHAVTWFAIGGDDVSVALRTTQYLNGATTTVNDMGFDPSCVLFGYGSNATTNAITSNRGDVGFGVLTGAASRSAGFGFAQENDNRRTSSAFNNNRAVQTSGFNAWRPTTTITTSLVSGGFQIVNSDTQPGWCWALGIAGVNVALLASTLRTSAGDLDLTGAGFTPKSALTFGLPQTTAVNTDTREPGSVLVGVTIGDTAQASAHVIGTVDTQRTGDTRSSASLSIATLEKTGVATFANEAAATASFLPDGIRYSFTDGHTVAGHFAVLLTDGTPGLSNAAAAWHHYYR
jgi:hypothetical protein